MTRIKILGLALAAVCTISAMTASMASAGTVETESGGNNPISGAQEGKHRFVVEGNVVECNTAEFQPIGETANGAAEVTVHPVYKECKAVWGFINGTVETAGCTYTLSAPGSESSMRWAASLVLNCGTGHITITAGTCAATIANQTVSSGIVVENTTVSPMDVMVRATEAPVATVKTEDGFLCPLSGKGAATGLYSGVTTSSTGFTVK